MNTDSNVIDVSHSQSMYHELPDYGNANRDDGDGLMALDDEEPFVGLAQHVEPMPESNFGHAARKFDEMEARHQRTRTDAGGAKHPGPNDNAYQ